MNSTAVVQTMEETIKAEKTAQDWHDQAIAADKARSDSSLRHAEALYMLQDKYLELGYESFPKYVFDNFGKSESWAKKLIQIHTKFVVSLGRSPEELQSIGFGKLGKLASIVDTDNADQILDDAKNMTQSEIDVKIKESKGLEHNETKVDDEISRISFKAPKELTKMFNELLKWAKTDYAKDVGIDPKVVNDYQGLEMMLCTYNMARSVGRSLEHDRDELLRQYGKSQKIEISYKRIDEVDNE